MARFGTIEDEDGEVVAAFIQMGMSGQSERELALDFILSYVIDALHDGRISITREDMMSWRAAAIARGQWGHVYDATRESNDLMTLRVNWQELPQEDDDDERPN